jgi:hypothetical protein
MLLEQVAEIQMVVRSGRALSSDNRANRRMEAISYRASSMAPSLIVPMLHAVNTQHGLQRISVDHLCLGIKRLDEGHILPWQNLLHAGENLGLTALMLNSLSAKVS